MNGILQSSLFTRLLALRSRLPALIGCAVGPNYKRPSVDVPVTYRGAQTDDIRDQIQHAVAGRQHRQSPVSRPRSRWATRSGGRFSRIRELQRSDPHRAQEQLRCAHCGDASSAGAGASSASRAPTNFRRSARAATSPASRVRKLGPIPVLRTDAGTS